MVVGALGGWRIDMHEPLDRAFYDRDPRQVARDLLGKRLVRAVGRQVTAGAIVEVEAYLCSGDSACHAWRGRTPRNASMFGPPGHAYVYAIHSRWCLNVVTQPAGVPSAVLIRAVEPLEGLAAMRRRRAGVRQLDWARGPARLCQAMAIDRKLDGWDLTLGRVLWVAHPPSAHPPSGDLPQIVTTTRIGVTSAQTLLLRYALADSPFVSHPRRR